MEIAKMILVWFSVDRNLFFDLYLPFINVFLLCQQLFIL